MKKIATSCWFGLILVGILMQGIVPAMGADRGKGEVVYKKKGCAACHAVDGKGGKIGPDLSAIGNKRDSDWLMKFLKDPKGTVPGSKHMTAKVNDDELVDLTAYLSTLKK